METQQAEINYTKIMLCLLSGFLLTAGFPLIGASYSAWVAVVFLLFAIRDLPAGKAFYLGLLAGFSYFITLLYWLIGTINTYGFLPLWLSVSALILLSFYLSLYPAVFSALVARFCLSPVSALVMIPVFWVITEYLRSFLFSGFPWGLIGYTQYKQLHLIQISDIFGIYGISFLIVFANAVIFFGLLFISGRRWQGRRVGAVPVCVSMLVLVSVVAAVMIYGKARLKSVDRMISKAESINVALIQGNIGQPEKWDKRFETHTIEKYLNLSRAVFRRPVQLVVWPETAAPFYFKYDRSMTDKVLQGVRSMKTEFLIGAPTVEFDEFRVHNYNSAYLVSPDGEISGRYDKVHLVPFGEYVPLKKWLPFIHKMVAQVGDFKTGEKGSTLKWERADIGVQICYEIIFPRLAAEMVKNHADLLINITNDAWFGRTGAPYQHFSMAVFRTIENRRSLVRAANTGISGFIDPAGRILETTGLFKEAAITRQVAVIRGETSFYTRHGDLLALACFIASLVFVMIRIRKRRSG